MPKMRRTGHGTVAAAAAAPSNAPIDVVAAAIVRDARVLAARRSVPAELAGGWEFPGGKVEPGESAGSALRREIREELGVGIRVGDELARAGDGRIRLALYAALLTEGEPAVGHAHDELRWLPVADLADLAWLPIDAELLPAVRTLFT